MKANDTIECKRTSVQYKLIERVRGGKWVIESFGVRPLRMVETSRHLNRDFFVKSPA